jgi:hypothetical protein
MRTEKVVLSFIAVLVGVLVTGGAFYLYQSAGSKEPEKDNKIVINQPSPTPKPSIYLNVESPQDESVVTKKVVPIKGSTAKGATIIIITPLDQEVIAPSPNGDFSTTINIDDGQNFIEITAISENGEEARVKRTVTFSTEEF